MAGQITCTTLVATTITGTISTAAQPNVTSLGTLSALQLTNNQNAATEYKVTNTNGGTSSYAGILFTSDNPGVSNTGGIARTSSGYTDVAAWQDSLVIYANSANSIQLALGTTTYYTQSSSLATFATNVSTGSNSITGGAISGTNITSNAGASALIATFDSSNAIGGYAQWKLSGTAKSYFGAAKALNGALANDDFAIDARGGGKFYLMSGGVVVAETNSAGLVVTGKTSSTSFFETTEIAAPSAGAANTARIFAVDSGGGKTVLKVQFATGAAQTIATEP